MCTEIRGRSTFCSKPVLFFAGVQMFSLILAVGEARGQHEAAEKQEIM